MKNLKDHMNEALDINEVRNYPYRILFSGCKASNGEPMTVNVTLDSPRDANTFDKWLENELDNTIVHASGGPNDIEL